LSVKLGLLPPYRLSVTADPAWMGEFARHADEAGFESLLTVEHVVVPEGYASTYPYSDTGRMPLPDDCDIPDPLDLLAWIAGRTERLRLGTGILVLPEHHPLQLAKRIATIDRLSGGRVFLGVGVGWMREELEAVGVDFDTRGSRTDESMEALRATWRDEVVSFTGQHFAFAGVRSHPKPVQASPWGGAGVPLLVGGHSGAAARRAGRLGDGFFPLGLAGDPLDRRLAQVAGAAREAGRDPADVPLTLGGLLGEGTSEAAIADARRRGAERVVLSTRIDDLDQLRRDMDAAVAAAAALA
jgi:probable F420-dependent oxidoreductase